MSDAQRTFGGRLRPKPEKPTWENLVDLSNEGMAFVYQRLSSHEQVKKSIYSIKAQDALVDLAQEDGYTDNLIHIERRDLGVSGTKGREERVGLAHLIDLIEAGKVEAVYVVHVSRLYRDQTLVNALVLGEVFKEHGVIIVTPQMRLNLRDKMHMRLYRMEVERAADELERMAHQLLGARDLKAKSGAYAGENLPPGYIVDEREKLDNGDRNPNYHTYQIYEPHAKVVRIIFVQMSMPGITLTRVARHCKRNGITFPPFIPELDTPVNRKTFVNSKLDPDNSWPITVERVRCIVTNPAYIGWRVWAGEVVNKNTFPPIVDEQTFWAVQDKLSRGESRPKRERDPLPLAGLLYCSNQNMLLRMTYTNRNPSHHSIYRCYCHDRDDLRLSYTSIAAHILDGPVSEAVINQLTALSDLPERTLQKYADEYEQAKAQAASYRREMKRLEAEVKNLRGNFIAEVMSPNQLEWLNEQIDQRLDSIEELADLENQPIGAMMKHHVPGQAAIESVRTFLENLGDEWPSQPNGFKNTVLRLLLDQVTIWHEPATIRVRLTWRAGFEREMLIHRPVKKKRQPWTDAEFDVVKEHYATATKDELLSLLPGRTWKAIKRKGHQLGLKRKEAERPKGTAYTPEEDELVRRYYAGEIERDEVMSTGRTADGIEHRARRLGLTWQPRKATWNWLDDGRLISQSEGCSGWEPVPRNARGKRRPGPKSPRP
jgi:DNA invertase Pin-like site-specific DNA recombinase